MDKATRCGHPDEQREYREVRAFRSTCRACAQTRLHASIPEEPRPKRQRIDWSNVVIDEGDEAP